MRQASSQQFAVSLYEVLAKTEKAEVKNKLRNFLLVLKKHKSLKKSDKIIRLFGQYFDKMTGLVEVEVTSAASLKEETRRKIINHLEKSLNKKVVVHEKIDSSLIGGLKIRYEDTIIDGSLKNKLEILRNKIS